MASVSKETKALRKLGRALHMSSSTGNILVKSNFEPKVGMRVLDGELRQVGLVFDVIGPVDAPYISIKPTIKTPEKTINKMLFLTEDKKTRRRN